MTDVVVYVHCVDDNSILNGTNVNNAMDMNTPDTDHDQEDDDGVTDCPAVSSFVNLARTVGKRM